MKRPLLFLVRTTVPIGTCLFVLIAAAAASASVQDARRDSTIPPGGQLASRPNGTAIETPQGGRNERPSTAAAQIGSASPALPVPPLPPDDGRAVTQVAAQASSTQPVAQLSPRDRSVPASERLTGAKDSRTVATARIGGADRCDPERGDQAATAACRQAIETRAASFAREQSDLSPEQRLLAERYTPTDRLGLAAQVRRIGRNDVDPSSDTAQTLATIIEAQRATDQAAIDAATKQQAAEAANAALISTLTPQQR